MGSRPDDRLSAILEYATDLVIEVGRSGDLIAANPAFLGALGRTLGDVIARPLWPSVHPDDCDRTRAALEAAFDTGQPAALRFRIHGAAPGWVTMSGTLAPFEAEDGTPRAVAVLRRRELDRAEAIVESVPGVVLVLELDGAVREANPYVLDLTHRTRDEVIGADWIDLFISPEEQEAVRAAFASARSRGSIGAHMNAILTRGGERRLIEWNCRVLHHAAGDPDAILAVGNDVTERERALDRLRRGQSLLRTVLENTPSLIFALDRNGIFTLAEGSVFATMGFRPGEAVGQSVFERYANRPDVMADLRRAFAGEPVRTKIVARDDVILDAAFAPYYDAQGQIAGVVGTALDVTEQEQARRATAASEARLNAILQTEPECVKVVDHRGLVTFMNPAGLALVGVDSFQEVAHRPAVDLVAPEYREVFERTLARVLAGTPEVVEFEIITTDGGRRRVRQHAAPLPAHDPLVPPAMLAVTHDVTALRAAESATRSAYDLTRTIVDATPDWVFVKDLDLRFVVVNRSFAAGQGVQPDDMIGRSATDFWSLELCEGDPERGIRGFHTDDREVLTGRTVHNPRLLATLGTGEIRILDTLKVPLHDREGRVVGVVGYSRDITEREAAVAALHRSEALLREAESLAHVGAWSSNPLTGEQTWTDENYRLYGLEPGSVPPSFEAFMAYVHPEDRAGIGVMFAALMEHGSQSHRFRVVRADGVLRHMEAMARVVRDASGAPVRVDGVTQDVTEREQTLAALQHSQDLLTEAQRLARIGNWALDFETDRLTWSRTVFDIFEVDEGALDPSYEAFLERVHPDDRDAVAQTYAASLSSQQRYLITHRILMPDGRVKWVEERAESEFAPDGRPLTSHGTVQDITEQVLLRDAADRTAHELARIVESSPLPIIVIDERGQILNANPATERTFAWPRETLLGQNVAVLAADVDIAQHEAFIQHYRETGEASTAEGLVIGRTREVRAKRSDGTEFPADLTVADIQQPDGARHFVGILLDRTEWRAREEQIIRMQKLDAMGTLIAGVAHDFNNLLTAIIGGIEMAIARPNEPRWAQIARDSADRATDLVHRLLRFSRDESPNRQSVPVAPIVDAVVAIARETMDRRIWFSTDVTEGLPNILADAGQIEQVLLNLVVNARDAVLDRAEVSDYHYRPSIRVAALSESREGLPGVAIRVTDNGSGMSEDTRRRAFDPFFTTKSVDRGTGLGLSIASGILSSHQGFIDLDTREGAGTTIALWLPSPTATLAAAPDADAPADARPRPSGTRGRVLLVDDETMIGEVAEAYLASAGYEVTLASTGAAAIRLARDTSFDIAVIDLNMPPPDGWAVLSVLRVMQPDVPVVIASGFAAAADVAERGGAALLSKPYSRDQLIAVVAGLLG